MSRLGIRGVERSRPLTASMVTAFLVLGANLCTGVLLTRSLGPHARGQLAAVILWPSLLATIGGLGVAPAVAVFTANGSARLGRLVGTALALAAVQSVLLCAVGAGAIPLVLSHYGAGTASWGLVFLLFVPVTLTVNVFLALLSGLHRFASFQLVRLASPCGVLVGLGALALAGRLTVGGATVVYLGINGAITVVLAAAVGRRIEGWGVEWPLARRIAVFGLKSHTNTVSSLLNERLDQLMISAFLSSTALGIYATAVAVTSVSSLVGSSVAAIALPVVARLTDPVERARAIGRYLRLTVIGAAALSLPVLVAAPYLIPLVFGSSFAPAATPARILLVASVPLALAKLLAAILNGLGLPLQAGNGEFVALGVTAVGLGALLPLLGLNGAALTSLAAYSTSSLWMLRRTRGELGLAARPRLGLSLRGVATSGMDR